MNEVLTVKHQQPNHLFTEAPLQDLTNIVIDLKTNK